VFALDDGVRCRGRLAVQHEIEADLGMRRVQTARLRRWGIHYPPHLRDQPVAGGEGEVVVQVFVARDVNLRGQLAVSRRLDEEVDVRGVPA
jgi:hypothetical protein